VHYRALRNKHQLNEVLPSFPSRPRRGESVQNWARRRVWRYVIFPSKGLLSLPKVIFSPSQRRRQRRHVIAYTNFSYRKRVRRCEPDGSFFPDDDPSFHRDYYFATPLPHGSTIGHAGYIYVYNCKQYIRFTVKNNRTLRCWHPAIINYPTVRFHRASAKCKVKKNRASYVSYANFVGRGRTVITRANRAGTTFWCKVQTTLPTTYTLVRCRSMCKRLLAAAS